LKEFLKSVHILAKLGTRKLIASSSMFDRHCPAERQRNLLAIERNGEQQML